MAFLREERETIRQAWMAEMTKRGLFKGLTPEEAEAESAVVYDALVECLETGRYHSAQAYAQDMAERDVFRGIGAKQVIGRLLVLRDACGRALHARFNRQPKALQRALDLYEPVMNRILTIVAMAFLQERERAVGRGREQLAALVEAGMTLTAERSPESVLQRIVEVACRLLDARYGALGILDGQGGLGQFITTGISEEVKARIGPLPVGKGILGVLVREAKPLRLPDLTQDPRGHGFPPNHPPMHSFLGVPIISKGRLFGNLYLTEKQGAEEFSKEDEKLAVTLAAQAAIAIENASLYEEVQRSEAGTAGQPGLAEFQEYLTLIQEEVSRAASIVRRLLDFARQREPSFGLVDLQGVVANAVAFVQRQARLANQQIVVDPVPEGSVAYADAQMLQQVFLNLLTNALDAIEGGGEVRIAARHRRDPGGRGPGRAWLDVMVSDTG
ncbi:MAG: GAF domain-containing protein, partial [candidate division NC10 bacterium]|nr:GAF domain-containing protein [candidate division NC10 bacterium]